MVSMLPRYQIDEMERNREQDEVNACSQYAQDGYDGEWKFVKKESPPSVPSYQTPYAGIGFRKNDEKEQVTYKEYMRSMHSGFFDYRRAQIENHAIEHCPINASAYDEYMKKMHDAFFTGRIGG